MVRAKPLAFDRVRVLAESDGRLLPRPERRRPELPPRNVLVSRWREPSSPLGGLPQQDLPPELPGDAALPRAAAAPADVAEEPDTAVATETSTAEFQAPAPDAAPEQPSPPQAGDSSRDGQSGGNTSAAGSVMAIARAVDEMAMFRSLARMVVQNFGGDDWRGSGPWEFSMPLADYGLGDSLLKLRLSPGVLALRFLCRGEAARGVLSRHGSGLHSMLQQQLQPELEVEMSIDED